MTLETYKDHLMSINFRAVCRDRLPHSTSNMHRGASEQLSHADRAISFAFNAIASVAHERVSAAYWDVNSDENVAALTEELDDGTLQLPTLL